MTSDWKAAKALNEALKKEGLARAQDRFLGYYSRLTGFYPPAHVKVMSKVMQALEEDLIDRAMVFAPPRHAKRLADDTPILTANRGWTTHGDLKVGDQVWHPDSSPTTVTGVSDPGQSDILIRFSNGEEIQCDGDHLWKVWDRGRSSADRYRGFKTWEILPTDELIRRGVVLSGRPGKRGARYRWHLPEVFGIEGSPIKTNVGPYTLGAWLGDGTADQARVTCATEDIDAIVAAIKAEGYTETKRYVHATTGVPTASFGEGRGRKSKLREHLEQDGVWANKHIPAHWITASVEQRKLLLAGLMDTDGHCEPETGRCRIVTVSEKLAIGIRDLCNSLGYRPCISSQKPDGITDRHGITSRARTYTVGFQPFEQLPCGLPRKIPVKFALRRAVTIRSIERVKPKRCRCIKVSAHDGMYLAGRALTPTHNTTMFSHLGPSWVMGRHPSTKIMQVAHTQKFASKIGRTVRNMVRRPEYPFDVEVADDSAARDQWATDHGGEYNAFGAIGGNQHGNPAEWLFMDDLVKGRKIAMSPHMREETWETYKTDLLSRLEGRAKQVMVFTRWNEDDPAGRILPDGFDGSTGWYRDRETNEPWYVLSLPAVAEHDNDPLGRKAGEWLWPERFGEKKLGGMQRRGGWIWSALYQQRPAPQDGLIFKAEWFEDRYDPLTLDRTSLIYYGTSDYAVTDEAGATDPDYTVHCVWGVDKDFNIYLIDMWRGRTTADIWAEAFCKLVKRYKPLRWFEEAGQIRSAVGPFLEQMIARERAFTDRVSMPSVGSKEHRATMGSTSFAAWASQRKVYLPNRAAIPKELLVHVDALEKELLQFPTGKHDDCVDNCSLIGRALDRMIPGRQRDKKDLPHEDTLEDLFRRNEQRD